MTQQGADQSRAGGSVRRARERMQAGLPPEMDQASPPPHYKAPSPPSNRSRPQIRQALQGQGRIGVAISRPTQVPQWPLVGTIETVLDPPSHQLYQPPPGRGVAPQRPPRPSHVPSMLDASRLQDHTPSFPYKARRILLDTDEGQGPEDEEEEIMSPDLASPNTQTSRQSTISSTGSIPDFPMPMPPPHPVPLRKSANLGPPPISRRGASSYYSQMSLVSPIPEESPKTHRSHGSYASSTAIPPTWGSDSPGYGFDDEEEKAMYGRDGYDVIAEGRESRESNLDDSDDRGLIRNASLGKRAKPSMIMTKNAERIELQPHVPQSQKSLERMGAGGRAVGAAGGALTAARTRDGQRETVWPMIGNTDGTLGGQSFIESTSSSDAETPHVAKATVKTESESAVPGATAMLGAYNAASSLQPPGTTPSRTSSPGSRLSALRRPPRLDMDAVRDAEARGSLTSLPDLIRRATKLAALIDRGKRPGSRLNNLDDFPSEVDVAAGEKEADASPVEKRRSGLSGMLAAFPPPGMSTPTAQNTLSSRPSSWPAVDFQDGDQASRPKRRRCCGLPCWGFLLVILILLIIIAAAVVVPLELLVFHKPNTTSSVPVTGLQACSQNSTTACQNGGISSLTTGACSCICINGFTGSTCSVSGASGCTTTTISTGPLTYTNVTVGDSIPRLIAAAQTNFSIPISGTVILARFNSASLSCVSENALVTFDGESQRVGSAANIVQPASTSSTNIATPTPNKVPRATSTSTAPIPVATKNGILYDPASQYASNASPSVPSSTPASPASSAVFAVTEEVLDFARTAVLFILQQEDLSSAEVAQSNLQHFFNSESFTNQAAQNVSLGSGNFANLLSFSVDLGNGSVGAANASMTRRDLMSGRGVKLW